MEPGFLMALLAGSAEFFDGLALALGLLTCPAATVSALTMVIALLSAHIQNGLFLSNGGYMHWYFSQSPFRWQSLVLAVWQSTMLLPAL